MRWVWVLLLFVSMNVTAAEIPPNAVPILPIIKQAIKEYWPELKYPSVLGGQPEQETCPSLTSPKCFNPKTENKNPKNNGEYGWGLGQLTNTTKYNNFQVVRGYNSFLSSWTWENRFDPKYQIVAMIEMDRRNFQYFEPFSNDKAVVMQFALSAYNGGAGGLKKDILICQGTPGCNPKKWFGNVALHSYKSQISTKGYSKSFFDINREYVDLIWNKRRQKYIPVLGEDKK